MEKAISVRRMEKALENLLPLLTGGVGYVCLEYLARGRSHWSMAVCGALCFWFLYQLTDTAPKSPLLLRALLGCLFITATECLFGCVLNLWLELDVWDYSNLPYQLLGQICLPYSALWFLLCIPALLLCGWMRRAVFWKI